MISRRNSGNQEHKYYITYIDKTMNVTEHKHHKARDIASATVCHNPDPNIYLPH